MSIRGVENGSFTLCQLAVACFCRFLLNRAPRESLPCFCRAWQRVTQARMKSIGEVAKSMKCRAFQSYFALAQFLLQDFRVQVRTSNRKVENVMAPVGAFMQ